MSPGVTFERVYRELKRMLAEGELPPGTPIEPALIGKQIASSITPIRDALHRLTGEWLVEAPNHNGFRVPLLTEAGLRDLYSWNAQMLRLAVQHIRSSAPKGTEGVPILVTDVREAIASLFVDMVRPAGSGEHIRAIQHLNEKLASFRRAETRLLGGLIDEYEALARSFASGDRVRLRRLIDRYHRRRILGASDILAANARGEG